MARDLYVSPYALSRIFSSVFHTNFNGYLNEFRLDYAIYLLRYTTQTITEVYENAGFNSQRTFNRVFQDRFHMSPRDYREEYRRLLARSSEEEDREKTFRPYYHFETGSPREEAKEA
jgi:AraC-like DNA-binding protein